MLIAGAIVTQTISPTLITYANEVNKINNIINSTKSISVTIPDANLKAALNKAIDSNKADNQPITQAELESLTGRLNLYNKNISNLEGVQYCTNVTSIDLNKNNYSALTPLASLTKLTNLRESYLDNQNITEPEVTSVGAKATVNNMIKGLDGNPIAIAKWGCLYI